VATSTDLNVWSQDSTASFESSKVAWAFTNTPEFRDPFVMPDPDHAGHYLLYFVTRTKDRKRLVVGVASTRDTTPGDLRSWTNPLPFWSTDSLRSGAAFIESPHAFKDPGNRWWLYYTGYNVGVGQDNAFVTFQTSDVGPADTTMSYWSAPDTLFKFLGGDQKLQFWHASEYYQWASGYEYLMAFNDSEHSVDISQISWRGPHTFVLTDSCPPRSALDVPGPRRASCVMLDVLGARPSRPPVLFRLSVPTQMPVELAIFDIAGRLVRTVVNGVLPGGQREIRWDGQDGRAGRPMAGVYFARLSTTGGQRIEKLVLLR
jgi:hypothetical protein